MQNKRNLYIVLGIAVFAILILVIGLTYKNRGGNTSAGEVKVEETKAPQGEVIENFPAELMIESNPVVKDSGSLKYEFGSQPSVNYYSKFGAEENLSLFRRRLATLKYNITNDSKVADGIYSIYAVRGTENVNITIIQTDSKAPTNVIMAYVKM